MSKATKSLRQANAEDAPHGRLKIGEVSKLSGIGIETLRFYEKSGLLKRPARTGSGYRMYDGDALERLAFIKRAQVLGFSLSEIKQIIAEKDAGQSPCSAVREVVRRRLHELDERMAQMRLYRKELAGALAEWDEAGDVRGHICGLIEGTDIKHPMSSERVMGNRQGGRKRKRSGEHE
ncbi:MAG: heavy metal-responsive transcriptional regulator [Pyrinomonadaceae bacterium]